MASAWHWLAKVRSDVKPAAPHQPCLNRSFVKASLHGSHVACQSCVYPYCLDMCSSSPLGISSVLISTLPAHSPAFFPQNLSRAFPVFVVANTCSCVGPQNKLVHLVHRYEQFFFNFFYSNSKHTYTQYTQIHQKPAHVVINSSQYVHLSLSLSHSLTHTHPHTHTHTHIRVQ